MSTMSDSCEEMIGLPPPVDAGVPEKILCVGIVCLDIVQTCRQFPSEDSSGRSVDYKWQRGGNASNTCTVLSLLGQSCELLAYLSKEHGSFLQNDLRKYRIGCRHCPLMSKDFGCPTSTVILSQSTGSRTIIYHKANLPDLTFKDFEAFNLEEYSWIHFEGRNLNQLLLMIRRIRDYNNSLKDVHIEGTKYRVPITVSVELERPESELLDLLLYADVAFIAKDFAKSQGFSNMDEIVKNVGRDAETNATTIICTWAEKGAMARTVDGKIVQSPAFPPQKVIDTLGAGDTFNAAVLYYLNKCKAEFINRYEKEETTCMKSTDRMKNESDNGVLINLDVKQNFDTENFEYSPRKFIDETVLQKAITFGCHIAGAKVGLRGYDGLDEICVDILLDRSID